MWLVMKIILRWKIVMYDETVSRSCVWAASESQIVLHRVFTCFCVILFRLVFETLHMYISFRSVFLCRIVLLDKRNMWLKSLLLLKFFAYHFVSSFLFFFSFAIDCAIPFVVNQSIFSMDVLLILFFPPHFKLQLRNWCCLFDKWDVKWIFVQCKDFHHVVSFLVSFFSFFSTAAKWICFFFNFPKCLFPQKIDFKAFCRVWKSFFPVLL